MYNECPVCKNIKGWTYSYYTEEYWGVVEQHGYCERCGFIIEQAYSQPFYGFLAPQKKGHKFNGKWFGKNIRRRKRLKRKLNISYDNRLEMKV